MPLKRLSPITNNVIRMTSILEIFIKVEINYDDLIINTTQKEQLQEVEINIFDFEVRDEDLKCKAL